MAVTQFKDTTATKKIFKLNKRIRVVAGGTAASKTISILIWCIDYAQSTKNEIITVTSESFPHLEDGAIRDFQAIMKAHGYWKDESWHSTKHEYRFETGSIIEFVSVDTYGKAHGPRRDILFMNEGNYLSWLIADQLMTRTRKIVWIDFNPTEEFWFYSEMQGKRDDIDFITLTYKDNEALDDITIQEIEAHRGNKVWWQVYGLGQLGEIETRIYKQWQIVDDIPHEARLERIGLDYGYSNDPTAIVAAYYFQGGYIFDEIAYQKGLSNKQIADIIKNYERQAPVCPDSAEPKSNDELKMYGITVMDVPKGKDSVRQGIQWVQDQRCSITKRSVNVIKEYRNYVWQTDRDGRIINEPEHTYSHSMDAVRYALQTLKPKATETIIQQRQMWEKNQARATQNSTK